MASRARHGHRLSSPHQRVNAIIPFIGLSLLLFAVVLIIDWSQRKQPQCRAVAMRFRHFNLIAGNLKTQKLVVGHVIIQSSDDPVAIQIALRIYSGLKRVGLIFGESSKIKPITSPAFAILRACEEFINQRLPCRFINDGGIRRIPAGSCRHQP